MFWAVGVESVNLAYNMELVIEMPKMGARAWVGVFQLRSSSAEVYVESSAYNTLAFCLFQYYMI